jgi:hypothetical protein
MISRVPPALLTATLFTTALSVQAAGPDFTIELGKRVGAIQKNSPLAQLKDACGAKSVKPANLQGPEGATLKGASLADVEAENGGAFKVSGFDWDLGGFAHFERGKLAGKVMVRFYPTRPSDESLSGDKQISTGDKKLRAARPTVSELFVVLR